MTVTPEFRTPADDESWPHTWVVVGELVISLTQAGHIGDGLWARFVEDVERPTTTHLLGLGRGEIRVSPKQRRRLLPALRGCVRVAGVMDSSVSRGVAAALSWMGADISGHAWDDVAGALRYVQVPEQDVARKLEIIDELLRRSGAPSIAELAG